MNVERIDVRLAPREPYEAQDLGLQLLRKNVLPTFATVAAVMVPVWAILLAVDAPDPAVSLFAIWWLKPLMDRVALHVLSQSVFGDPPRILATLASLPKLLDRPLLAALTWRRLQLKRSFWMPTACLEGLRGSALTKRQSVLQRGDISGAAAFSTGAFLAIEFGLSFSMYALVHLFLPEGFAPSLLDLMEDPESADSAGYLWISTLVWLPVLLLVECLYVAAGFGLYLCRRTELEGWDIELAFGRLAARVRQTARHGLAVALLAAALLASAPEAVASGAVASGAVASGAVASGAGASGAGASAASGSSGQDPQEALDPAQVAQEVLEHPDFATEMTREIWAPSFDSRGGGGGIGGLLAPILNVVAMAVLIGIVVALIVYLARRVELPRTLAKERAPRATEAFGLDLRPESLPDDVAEAAASLVRVGEFVPALSLLYRGALARLVQDDHLEIGPGDTEHDCIARVRSTVGDGNAPRAGYFAELTESWLRAAWGATPPTVDDALALCSSWRSHFRVVA